MSVDPFSDILKFANAETVVSGGFSASGSWAIRFPKLEKIMFSGLVRGGCWLRIDGEESSVRGEEGDVFLLSAQRPFVLSSDSAAIPIDAEVVFAGGAGRIAKLGDSEDCVLIGGYV